MRAGTSSPTRCARSWKPAHLDALVKPHRLTAALLAAIWIVTTLGNTHARTIGPRRTDPVEMVVIHSTGGPTCDAKTGRPIWVKAGSLQANLRFIGAHPKLGIHYMIGRDGTLASSVPEDQIAHHVFGHSPRSIAIELINDGDGVDPFPEPQVRAVTTLLQDITRRRGLARDAVKRHSDLDHSTLPCDRTQRRKVDPGPAFPFQAVLDAVFPPP